ncbi:glycosyltransferase family 4 protein [Zoogloea sp.]|uniref:glycosyltransferase family 4 protein n=1 Tax=Zoogloea sp. TaxID=49181 RepID=UPI001415CEDB|nr:MAG: glycosyltransferase family 4 protein [Zoogloea sp.]
MNLAGLRIALVGPLPPPAGGMANQTRQLAELLAGEGAAVELVQVNAPYRPAWVGRIQGLRAFARLLPYLWSLWRAAGRADLLHVMANSGWSWHLFSAPAVWIGALRGKPVVVNYHGGEAEAFLARAAAWVRPSMARASVLVLPSGFLLDVFARFGMPGRIVPNVVDLLRFRPVGPVRAAAAHIVVARNLEEIYGINTALRAFALILAQRPEARLSVAGSGPLEADLKALAERLGVAAQVRFTGRLDRDQMAALYQDADLSLNPSRVDNMPVSVLEALASGVPVVSTDVGGIPYLVRHEHTAMLVPRDEPEAMAAAALRVLGDTALVTRLREAGLEEVRRYSWQVVKGELLAVYGEAMHQSHQPATRRTQE